jgi:pimeloyl-ACP methyl ester carboxylesterase
MATDTAGLMDALGIGRAHVLGWSMGGYIAQTLALNHPAKVKRLVLAATSPGGSHTVPPLRFIQPILASDDLSSAALFALSFPPTRAATKAAAAYLERVEREQAELETMGVPPSSFTLDSTARAEQLEAVTQWKSPAGGVWRGLQALRSPALVANGNLDVIERPANDRRLAKRARRAAHCVFSATGHAFLFQEPKPFARMANLFLAARLAPKLTDSGARRHCERG